jgi:hypothetical protein
MVNQRAYEEAELRKGDFEVSQVHFLPPIFTCDHASRPLRVERTLSIDPAIGVGAEVITLRLDQIRRQSV